jgi:hypothetical protein
MTSHATRTAFQSQAVRILLYMCPHTAIYVSAYCYICVLILLYMCPHAAIYVSSYCYICVLILLYMCSICVHLLTTASLNTRKRSTHHLPDPPLRRLHLSNERLLDHLPSAHTPSSSAPVYRYCTLMPWTYRISTLMLVLRASCFFSFFAPRTLAALPRLFCP